MSWIPLTLRIKPPSRYPSSACVCVRVRVLFFNKSACGANGAWPLNRLRNARITKNVHQDKEY